jgi:hypothetical protein
MIFLATVAGKPGKVRAYVICALLMRYSHPMAYWAGTMGWSMKSQK